MSATRKLTWFVFTFGIASCLAAAAEDWPQWKGDARRSGDVPQRRLALPLGLVGAVPLGDAVLTS
ncbi:MAG: hypothetical protein HUU20_26285, partial [Pirellulales bacterium]|nr:hypothetical protein [Pirellulales bacterium]